MASDGPVGADGVGGGAFALSGDILATIAAVLIVLMGELLPEKREQRALRRSTTIPLKLEVLLKSFCR